MLHLDERSTQFRRSAPGREIAAGEPVEVQHPFQRGNVGGNIQRIGGKQLVQLVFKGGDEQIHAPLNALLCLSDVGALHILCRKLGVGIQQLQRGGQVVIHKFLQLGFFVRVLFCQCEDAGADILQPGDLGCHHRVGDGIVGLPELALQGGILILGSRCGCALWLKGALRGEFGISYKYKMDVLEVIRARLPFTLRLGGIGFLLTFFLALGLGVLCARHEDKGLDRALCKIGTVTSCIPEFWMSLMLILIFAVSLRVLPSSGAYDVGKADDLGSRITHLILPLTVVVLGHLWYYAYMVRNKMLEEMRMDYVLLAKSKGLGRKKILYRHCLRNVLPSYLSIMAISVPHVLGGTYIVESVFSYPGLGTLSYESARYKDYNLLMVLCILSGALVIACNLLAQALSERIDPRMRAQEAIDTWEADTDG